MKSLLRIGCQLVRFSLLAATLGAGFGLAQTPDDPPIHKGPPAVLRSVKMISDADGPALEIISSQTPDSSIEFLDSPPRLVIEQPPLTLANGKFVTTATLTSLTCKWPIGDPAEPGFHYCGHPPGSGRTYCDAHDLRGYQPRARRRPRVSLL